MIERIKAYFTPTPDAIGPLVGKLIFSSKPEIDFMIDPTNSGDLTKVEPRKISPVRTIIAHDKEYTIYGQVADTELNGELWVNTATEPPAALYSEYPDILKLA